MSDKLLCEKPNVPRSPRIPRGEVRVLASQNTWIEGLAVDQLKKTAELPGMKVAVGLPDLHPGKGSPIGAAFVAEGWIYPALVGNDIGCGFGEAILREHFDEHGNTGIQTDTGDSARYLARHNHAMRWASANRELIASRMLDRLKSAGVRLADVCHNWVEPLGDKRWLLKTFVDTWRGTVQWIARSPFRPAHKRKNWFVGDEVLEPVEETHFTAKDVKWETMRASGPGGQHVNRTESAVRATHLPTGVQATAMEERSQHRNRKLALARLAKKLTELDASRQGEARDTRWRAHKQLERGNPARVLREWNES